MSDEIKTILKQLAKCQALILILFQISLGNLGRYHEYINGKWFIRFGYSELGGGQS